MADINQLPKGWTIKKLEDISKIVYGKGLPTKQLKQNGYPVFGANGVIGFNDSFLYDDEQILISCRGAYSGKINISPKKCFITNNSLVIEITEEINKQYLYYALKNANKTKLITGTAQPQVTINNAKELKVLVPPIKTQQAIVSKIEELFSELDKGIEDLKMAQQQLKVYRQSVLKHAFEGRLTNENVKEGELPEGWKWVIINEIGQVKGGKRLPKGHKYSESETDFHYIMAGNLKEGTIKNKPAYISEDTYNQLLNYRVTGGEVYITIVGACIGDAGIIPSNINKSILTENAAKIINLQQTYNKYLAYYISSIDCQVQIKGKILSATLGKLALNRISSLKVPLPKLQEQQLIVKEIESRLSVADKLEESIANSLQKAEAFRQSILKKAFNGELITEVKPVEVPKIKNEYFYQLQLVALVINGSKKKKIDHGEMTLAKNLYLLDSIYNIPTGFKYDRWHLGPYPPALKKVVNNKEYFTRNDNYIEVQNEEKLLKYNNPLQDQITGAIDDLSSIFSKYKGAERSHKTELLATVCKVIEDIKSTDLAAVRESMQEWKIELKNSKFKTKAEKFTEPETRKCIEFIVERGWDRKLIKNH